MACPNAGKGYAAQVILSRDDAGFWNHLEVFIEEHSHASFSHGLCPECGEKLYGGQKWLIQGKKTATPKKQG